MDGIYLLAAQIVQDQQAPAGFQYVPDAAECSRFINKVGEAIVTGDYSPGLKPGASRTFVQAL